MAEDDMPWSADDAAVVLYGRGDIDDPYSAPMLGLMWGAGDHAGDGAATPVTVRGMPAVAAPITVFQQTILEELGTVIAWEEAGTKLGLYGRGWPRSRTSELLAVAERVEFVEGRPRLPAAALPRSFAEVYSGDPRPFSLVFPVESSYLMFYSTEDRGDGAVTVAGMVAPHGHLDAMRFLAPDLKWARMGDRDVLTGTAWHAKGPAVVAWHDPDGFLFRAIGQTDLAVVRRVATQARDLTPSEWDDVVAEAGDCPLPSPDE